MRALVAEMVNQGRVAPDASIRESTGRGIGDHRQQLGQYLDSFPAEAAPEPTLTPAQQAKADLLKKGAELEAADRAQNPGIHTDLSGTNVTAVVDYYGEGRDVAHGIADDEDAQIEVAAQAMAKFVKAGDILVPIPGRNGDAPTDSWQWKLASRIGELAGAKAAALLTGKKRESLYYAKKNGVDISTIDLGFKFKASGLSNVVLVDHVLATGTTMRAAVEAARAEGITPKGLVYAVVPEALEGKPQPKRDSTKLQEALRKQLASLSSLRRCVAGE
jgi:predicted amidophosphoribosyltransferase